MALADLTKQIAQQALLSATAPSKEPPAVSTDALGGVILGQIAAMQKQLKDDEELLVYLQSELSCWRQYQGVNMPCSGVQYFVYNGQNIGRRLTGTSLRAGYNIFIV